MKKIAFYSGLLALALMSNSCKESETEVTPNLSVEITQALNATITDEYRAQVVYESILNDFGSETRPFVNIKKAEIKHADALAGLLAKYQLEVPSNDFKVADMPTFKTVQEACALGVTAEIENIELYDSYLSLDLPTDIRTVFENNRAASLNNHLPAFQNCSN